MTQGIFKIPTPYNEPIFSYAPKTKERELLKKAIDDLYSKEIEIPLYIGGKEIYSGDKAKIVVPHDNKHVLGYFHQAQKEHVEMAVKAANDAKEAWANMPWYDRAAIFLKAADLMTTKYRYELNASTMLGVSKNAYQAEIDVICELADFFRFNVKYLEEIMMNQPNSPKGQWNRLDTRPLDGFVFAVTPFNFTSIAGNLPTSPAMMGNTVIWKPASSAVYPAYFVLKVLIEAGLPAGVINMVPGKGSVVGPMIMDSEYFGGVHFTGSTGVFNGMWQTISNNINKYKTYPRIVGETGGKDFIFAHNTADVDALVTATIRGAFEYQGQKCSAASRMFVPKSIWGQFSTKLLAEMKTVKMGDVKDFRNFVNAVVDKAAFNNIKSYIDYAKGESSIEILHGGKYDDSIGYFIEPTILLCRKHDVKVMTEEIFGPVFSIYVYEDEKLEETLQICDTGSPYALTGAVFSQDRAMIIHIMEKLRHAAGNFYINDKPTGAVVGQQPFGGGRASGTNDKAGSILNLLRWVSPRAIKENFIPPTAYQYPFMDEE